MQFKNIYMENLSELIYSVKKEENKFDFYSCDPLGKKSLVGKISLNEQVNMEIEIDRSDSIFRNLEASVVRSGILEIENLEEIFQRLKQVQDMWLSIDTNVLLNCFLTKYLIPEFSQKKPDFWLLVIVPKIALMELENMANNTSRGHLTSSGRAGWRGIQEMLEVRKKVISSNLIVTGEYPPPGVVENNVIKDMAIRKQATEFFAKIDVFGGTFFLTCDKTQALFAEAEGIPTIHVRQSFLTEQEFSTSFRKFEKLLYELTIQYGGIELEGEKSKISLKGIWKDKVIDNWINGELMFKISPLK